MSGELVLVTGGSGFIGSHCILQLLAAGYRVRTTVRSLNRETTVREMLKTGGAEPGERLSVVVADLMANDGWPEAVAGCDFVLHVASPFPAGEPKHADELIIPARDGTLRVLRAARDAGVKRVVLTSSFAAIGYGRRPTDQPFSETIWTDPNSGVRAYVKSKTLAEHAAWDFIEQEGDGLDLSVVNPVGVFGPVLGPDYSSSIQIVQRLMAGAIPSIPRLSFGIVDVRDVADLHLRAMTNPSASGERFLAAADEAMTLQEIARVLKNRMGDAASLVPTRTIPNWVMRLTALIAPSTKQVVPSLGKMRKTTNEKARRVLSWEPRSNEEAIVATAESLVRLGLLQKSGKAIES
jgi:dihydroflavonol-4-reductase